MTILEMKQIESSLMDKIQYYSHLGVCGCEDKIEIKKSHKYDGIPKYING